MLKVTAQVLPALKTRQYFYSVQTICRFTTEEAGNEVLRVVILLQLCEAINTLTIS